jgi:aspartyl-tRNA(Asn)/glutamyl-tRNA(Gln) amidotransferase subunit A
MTELLRLDASALVEGYRDGAFTPADVVAELQGALQELEPRLNSYCFRNPALAEEAAASARRWQRGQPCGPLDGVPVSVKDNLAAAGMPASWGNAALAERTCAADELPVARLRAAGALFVGKANTPEFAVEGYTGNATFGVTGNPFDPALTPGGSSGGVVAAVAAGLAQLGLGTDGGGSIRRPSAYCGLVGLKPGIGHVPRGDGLPQVLLDFEVVGPIARSVRDVALADRVLSVPDPLDPRSTWTPSPRLWSTAPRVLFAPRLGDAPCDPEILAAVTAAADRLADFGCAVTEGSLPLDLEPLNAVWSRIGEIGLARLFEQDAEVREAAAPKYREMAERGAAAPATVLWAILDMVADIRQEAAALFADSDIVLTPSCAAMPWPAGESFPHEIGGEAAGPRGHAIYTGWVNAAGLPALQLPARRATSGLPIGFQLVGATGTEEMLLALGARYEETTGGFVWPTVL